MSVGVFDGPRPQATAEEAGPHVGGIAAHARETQRPAFMGACGDVLVLAAMAARLVAAGLITASATATVLAAPFQGLYQPADGARRADNLGSACAEQAVDQRDHCRGSLGTLAGEQVWRSCEAAFRRWWAWGSDFLMAAVAVRSSRPVSSCFRILRMASVPSSAGGCFWHLGKPSWSWQKTLRDFPHTAHGSRGSPPVVLRLQCEQSRRAPSRCSSDVVRPHPAHRGNTRRRVP